VWDSTFTTKFDKGVRRQRQLNTKINSCIKQLLKDENPSALTIYKKNLDLNVYEINKQYRIGIKINSSINTIVFLSCCTHKEVYGTG